MKLKSVLLDGAGGVSYHDLMVALNVQRPEDLPIVSAMQIYLNSRSTERFVRN